MGKTFISLFSEFCKNEICQIYVYPSYPEEGFGHSFYRITDKDAIKNIFSFAYCGGEIKTKKYSEKEDVPKIYGNVKNSSFFRRLVRDLIWKFSHWYSKDLKDWICCQKPDCIFLAPGYAKFIYDIALKISNDYKIPIVTYICDDYFFVKQQESLLGKLQLFLLKQKIKETLEKSNHIIAICENIKKLYEDEFKTKASVIMTGSEIKIKNPSIKPERKTISYFGNIRCNRFVSLVEIGKTLDMINSESGTDYSLEIYSSEKNREILKKFDGIKSIKLKDFISGKDFEETLFNADILLHTEAFDEKSIDLVKNSVSTKIADSLASGIPLLAYGPKCVASMEHLIKNECAIFVADRTELKNVLEKAFLDDEECKKVVKNAILAARKYHNSKENSLLLKEIFAMVKDEII